MNGPDVVTIPIPGRGAANVLDAGALERLSAALRAAQSQGASGAVLHGPPGGFAAGADLDELARLDGERAAAFARRGASFFRALGRCRLWLAAAVDGPCIGGGLDLALACDLIVASPQALFRHPGARFGFPTVYGGNRRLVDRMGRTRGAEMLLRGIDVPGPVALRLGLVAELVPSSSLQQRARERLTAWAAAASPAARHALQEVVRGGARLPLAASIALERSAFRLVQATQARC